MGGWIKSIFGYIFRYALRVVITLVVFAAFLFVLSRLGLL